MKKTIASILFLGAFLHQSAFAQTLLTGISEFSSTAAGQASGGSVWNTQGGELVVNLFVSSGPGLSNPFLNGPNDANTSISTPLSLGVNTFTFLAGSGGVMPYHGMNLFFNGANSTARISVVAPTKTTVGTTPAFSANSSSTTFALNGSTIIPAANSLSFLDGNRLVTLTDYFWAAPSVFTVDRIAAPFGDPGHVAVDGVSDWVGQITLTVTQVPEPGVAAILLFGIAAVARRFKK